jgi:hypothetical protein
MSPEAHLEGVEAALKHALTDTLRELLGALGWTIELGHPLGERAIAIGDRGELQGGDIVGHPHGAFENGIL